VQDNRPLQLRAWKSHIVETKWHARTCHSVPEHFTW